MKRAIFRRTSIDVCIEHMVTATPISPDTLHFDSGEQVIVAVPKSQAGGVGEYQLLFEIDSYVGERPDLAESLFARADWKHVYSLRAVTAIEPFSLDDVVAAAGEHGDEVRYRYKGQTQHHRIIRTIAPEDEPLYRSFLEPATEPAWSASAVVARNHERAEQRRQAGRSHSELVRRLLAMDKSNRAKPKPKGYRPGKSQKRNQEFAALVRELYASQCQVCGIVIEARVGSRRAASVHHFAPWSGDASDRLDNVICVCPNHHAMFDLKVLRWDGTALAEWQGSAWIPRVLAIDKHLTSKLTAN